MHTNEYATVSKSKQQQQRLLNMLKLLLRMVCSIQQKKSGMPSMLGKDDVVNCDVSCDGTWQKGGYSSQNGCVIIMSIDTGEALDVDPLTKVCKQCQLHYHLDKESEEYRG